MKFECLGSVDSHETLKYVCAELESLHVRYHCRGNCISAVCSDDEPGTMRAVQDIFESLAAHTIHYVR